MEEKTAKSETHLPNLPDDLIVEQILARLPVHFWDFGSFIVSFSLVLIIAHNPQELSPSPLEGRVIIVGEI
ncbi:hypothetical protein BVRB_9g219210 isoform C [Beta vulgaris subsp. vulgaris]|nr:hypothetical protein BVRB_9g219210 isoform C [Beta vulgaris subsp. vulgaris]